MVGVGQKLYSRTELSELTATKAPGLCDTGFCIGIGSLQIRVIQMLCQMHSFSYQLSTLADIFSHIFYHLWRCNVDSLIPSNCNLRCQPSLYLCLKTVIVVDIRLRFLVQRHHSLAFQLSIMISQRVRAVIIFIAGVGSGYLATFCSPESLHALKTMYMSDFHSHAGAASISFFLVSVQFPTTVWVSSSQPSHFVIILLFLLFSFVPPFLRPEQSTKILKKEGDKSEIIIRGIQMRMR